MEISKTALAKDLNAIFKGRCCFHRSSSSEETEGTDSIDNLLATKDGLAAFRAFLQSEFSDENIEFWLACEEFKKAKTSAQIASKANKIYCDYIQTEAPKEINIDHKTRDNITKNISQPTITCFDEAQRNILCLMTKDSYPRFLKSDVYKEFMKKQQNTSH
ncbi:regulator of G-protein signaling 21-like [Pleurodeles waltl]|uniref:regulator of G-protein signaling 21-like n=1 Tax=Pleurodeles waltl TaxID=8319 RepID=UPI0037098D31